ncbi:MAG: sensor histidine kinase [Gemmatimonadaceae bacterium]|nr:sensor histidine kinase [Gemmatimonadaceae bacterium]
MTTVITVPLSLDDETFEEIFEQLAAVSPEQKVLIDARRTRWASPYGLTALLAVAQSRAERAAFAGPDHEETASYWARAGFYRHAEAVFEMHGRVPRQREVPWESTVLLEITDVSASDDVHTVVERIQARAQAILVHELHLDPQATLRFAMTLSEVCQNIVEHAGQGGWVAVQSYHFRQRLGRHAVVIAVCDAGLGFRRSLESTPGWKPRDRWDDGAALEDALVRGVSRYRDPGRGQGLAGVRKFVGRWNGKLSIRSGTARIAIVPAWDDAVPLQEGLPHFPGAQVQITIPERVTAA